MRLTIAPFPLLFVVGIAVVVAFSSVLVGVSVYFLGVLLLFLIPFEVFLSRSPKSLSLFPVDTDSLMSH